MNKHYEILAQTDGGSNVAVWHLPHACGIVFENKKGVMNLVLDDDKSPYITFCSRTEDGLYVDRPSAISVDNNNHLLFQVGGVETSVIDTANLVLSNPIM